MYTGEFGAECGVEHVTSIAEARRALDRESRELVIADARLPDGSGLDLVERLAPPPLGPDVIVWTAVCTAAGSVRAAVCGATYLGKIGGTEPDLATLVVFRERARRAAALRAGTEELKRALAAEIAERFRFTPKQRQVLDLIAQGVTSREELALAMGTSTSAIDGHRDVILDAFERFGCARSITQVHAWICDHAAFDAQTHRRVSTVLR